MQTKIIAVVMVKDEAAIIRRCLDSASPYVDAVCLVDTGSTDGTLEIARAWQGVPVYVYWMPWVDFGTNRTSALSLARMLAPSGYLLPLDADDQLEAPAGWTWPRLTHDAYTIRFRHGNLDYHQTRLFRASKPWRYVGVTHEYPHCAEPHTIHDLAGLTYIVGNDSSRRQSGRKGQEDARLLEAELADNPNDARAVFYLAQTYRELGRVDDAVLMYQRRVSMGGWVEERYYSLYQLGLLRGNLFALLQAWKMLPARHEAPAAAASLLLRAGDHSAARLLAASALETPPAAAGLFLDPGATERLREIVTS